MTALGGYRYLCEVAEEIILSSTESSKKLDNFLKKRFPIGYVRKLFRKNGLRLNGRHPKPDDPVHAGDRIELYIPYQTKNTGAAQKRIQRADLVIVFEDMDLVLINKPAGIAVHEGQGLLKRHSILGMLETFYRPEGISPHLVHRLDKDTSGLLLVAKSRKVAENLMPLFEEGSVDKEYLGLAIGRFNGPNGKIDVPLPGRDGRPVKAITRYTIVKQFADVALVKVKIETGRMHQIRLHFAKLGHPIVMDDQHGDFSFNKRFRKTHGLKRQFLHAARLSFEHRGKTVTFTAPLPEDLRLALAAIESESAKRRSI